VVVATRDRRERLLDALRRVIALPERPAVIVVDNASSDGTAAAIAAALPDAEVVRLDRNLGGAARTEGVRRARTPYVAFSDDDSWWAPGALGRAEAVLDGHPRLGLVAARVLVGAEERLDPTCAAMRASPLGRPAGLPGPAVLGFVACGAVVRREAFLEAGGFHPRLGVGGEEELLALDLAAAGWDLAYLEEVVAHHHPEPGPRAGRRRAMTRNALWCAWLRRPLHEAARQTVRRSGAALGDAEVRQGVVDAARGLAWVARERRRLPARVERAARALR
jgi:GT2 family glycosyltransferase